jgi:hypothetical protein
VYSNNNHHVTPTASWGKNCARRAAVQAGGLFARRLMPPLRAHHHPRVSDGVTERDVPAAVITHSPNALFVLSVSAHMCASRKLNIWPIFLLLRHTLGKHVNRSFHLHIAQIVFEMGCIFHLFFYFGQIKAVSCLPFFDSRKAPYTNLILELYFTGLLFI